jgi:N-acetylglucosamine-6-phosphate deacetylase
VRILPVSRPTLRARQTLLPALLDLHGGFVTPGLIDLQLNGAFGLSFSHHTHALRPVSAQLPQFGVTACCPTVISVETATLQQLLPTLQAAREDEDDARVLGIHLEGPFLNPQFRGAHRLDRLTTPAAIRLAGPSELAGAEQCFHTSLAGVKIVTSPPS